MGINLAVAGVLVAWGRGLRGPGRASGSGRARAGSNSRQAAVLGVAAGTTFGLTAALMKGMTATFAGGFGELFSSWQLYAMIAAGGAAMFLLQAAMNAGRLLAAQPGLTLADPIVSILWGVLVFGEQVRSGWFLVATAASGLVMAAAVVFLARSPLLSGRSAVQDEGGGPPAAGERASKPAAGRKQAAQ